MAKNVMWALAFGICVLASGLALVSLGWIDVLGGELVTGATFAAIGYFCGRRDADRG